ncbi:hypothetical protein BKG95_08595 [Rodentibacter pneumotropicus]|uniref:Uncharacterized protein n=1 Tax=Rodentibacter pneumotropicus TaxID=758 RepID=A0AAW5L9Y5_9PAST|nr:hypothetical protein [Rodentibacter pneumotropicus]MCQ9120271.1 hypothetical protein [Rodentibacter pneumotropicus]OOF67099.1 hypothetical protein BKG95_08595 [Rodentibacter pneumotropicus]
MDTITNFFESLKTFLQENKDILPYISTIIAVIWGFLKYNSPRNRLIRELELSEKYLSKDNFNKLEGDYLIIKSLTLRLFPNFRGLSFSKVRKLLDANIGDNDFFIFIELYKRGWVTYDNKLALSEKGEKLKKYSKWLWAGWLVFIGWCMLWLFFILWLSISNTLVGFFFVLVVIGIPEICFLLYRENIINLKKFKIENDQNQTPENNQNLDKESEEQAKEQNSEIKLNPQNEKPLWDKIKAIFNLKITWGRR